jgi:serine/threonine-protein kinase
LAAVGAAHSAGVLHRDIKPGNVLFTATGGVKVTDFGIAKTAESNQTATGEVLGTVAYLSPNRIEGKPAAVTDDLYAVGVMGYEMIAGFRPFGGDNLLSVARAILHHDATPLRALSSSADPVLVETVERAMSPDPAARFPDSETMRRALLAQQPWSPQLVPAPAAVPPAPIATRTFTSSVPASHALATPPSSPVRSPRRPMLILAVIAATVVAVVAGVLAMTLGSDDSNAPATTPSGSRAPASSMTAPQVPAPAVTTAPASTTTEAAPPPIAPTTTADEEVGNSGDDKKEKDKDKPANGNGNGNGNKAGD